MLCYQSTRGVVMTKIAVALAGLSLVLVSAHAAPPAAPPAQIEILVQKGKSTRLSGMDYDDKSQQFQFNVRIKNKEMAKSFAKLRATMVVTGKDTTREIYTILDHKESPFDLPLKGMHEFEGNSVSLEYDDNKYAKYGTKYEGYAIVVEDEAGNIVASKASGTSLLKKFAKLRELSVNTRYDDKFKVIPVLPGQPVR